jgi:hypothetical protein
MNDPKEAAEVQAKIYMCDKFGKEIADTCSRVQWVGFVDVLKTFDM